VASLAALVSADRSHWSSDAGFDANGLLMGDFASDTAIRLAAPVLLDRIRSSPGVTSAAVIGRFRGVTAWTDDPGADAFPSFSANVSSNFFGTLGVRLAAGRVPTREEIESGARLILLSRSTAVQAFGSDSNALGKRLHVRRTRESPAWHTVIGVVPDLGGSALWVTWSPIYIMNDRDVRSGVALVRATGSTGRRGRELADAAAPFRSQLTFRNIRAARALMDAERAERRGRALFMTGVGALSLALAIIGMYGLASYNAEARAREFGIRVALGAGPARLGSALLGELWPLAIIGCLVAFIAAGRVTTVLDTRLRGPMAEQPLVTFQPEAALATAGALVLVMLLGAGMPLRAVLRLDVMRAIRSGTAD
jgi:putative ABC transport system permease protein